MLRNGKPVDEALRAPAVLATRRMINGEPRSLSLADHAFGAGPHACPGQAHALAIAAGVLDAVRNCHLLTDPIEYAPSPNLRLPVELRIEPQAQPVCE